MNRLESELFDLEELLMRNDGMADDGTYSTIVGIANDVSELESENAKLRELCIDLFDRLRDEDKHCGECRLCEYDAWNFGDPKCVYAKRMRELGVLHAKE